MVAQLEEWAASGGFAWPASLVAKQEGITMRLVDPVKVTENPEWFFMYRAAGEIEELANIGATSFESMTEEQIQTWKTHPLSYLGSRNLVAVASWLDAEAERIRAELKKETP